MGDAIDEDLERQTEALLEPGEIVLNGAIVHTDFGSDEEAQVHRATVEIGDVIAEHADEADNTYVYSGNDDSRFSTNQHQGLTLDGDAFVWECQQLLRDGRFDVVFYYEAALDQEAILDDIGAAGFRVTGVEGG